ncbi:hypothetical protein [Accumulibacter sp.]|uniref:hypothetical protein n=1 Tax=Accumulibacter sp. TaxID=2053492 RepID=UPI001AD281B1|nr:hypothetical protein [Accumulibacter sp.]MBN8454273.1 hypothetical protein [Accumulibacter sp.]MBO3706587.1 hypothetical protein [Candidatus Accumulibacter conexus]
MNTILYWAVPVSAIGGISYAIAWLGRRIVEHQILVRVATLIVGQLETGRAALWEDLRAAYVAQTKILFGTEGTLSEREGHILVNLVARRLAGTSDRGLASRCRDLHRSMPSYWVQALGQNYISNMMAAGMLVWSFSTWQLIRGTSTLKEPGWGFLAVGVALALGMLVAACIHFWAGWRLITRRNTIAVGNGQSNA